MNSFLQKTVFIIILVFSSSSMDAQTWNITHYHDEFGDELNESFLYGTGKGTYINLFNRGDLDVLIVVSDFNIKMNFFEDGKNVTMPDNGIATELRIKDDNNQVHSLSIVEISEGTASAGPEYTEMISLIKKNKLLKLYYEIESSVPHEMIKYTFKIDCMGFSSKYNKIYKQ